LAEGDNYWADNLNMVDHNNDDNNEYDDYDNDNDHHEIPPTEGPVDNNNNSDNNDNINIVNREFMAIENKIGANGYDLIPEPRKVAQIKVNYATVAKRINVKALKDTIWDLLCNNDNNSSAGEDKENIPMNDLQEEKEKSNKISSIKSFKNDIVEALPSALSNSSFKSEVSVPFCFICLLHLANEKGLEIKHNNDYTDLFIK